MRTGDKVAHALTGEIGVVEGYSDIDLSGLSNETLILKIEEKQKCQTDVQ
jgi:hypothetical protein